MRRVYDSVVDVSLHPLSKISKQWKTKLWNENTQHFINELKRLVRCCSSQKVDAKATYCTIFTEGLNVCVCVCICVRVSVNTCTSVEHVSTLCPNRPKIQIIWKVCRVNCERVCCIFLPDSQPILPLSFPFSFSFSFFVL